MTWQRRCKSTYFAKRRKYWSVKHILKTCRYHEFTRSNCTIKMFQHCSVINQFTTGAIRTCFGQRRGRQLCLSCWRANIFHVRRRITETAVSIGRGPVACSYGIRVSRRTVHLSHTQHQSLERVAFSALAAHTWNVYERCYITLNLGICARLLYITLRQRVIC
jgi:hypothetical protein